MKFQGGHKNCSQVHFKIVLRLIVHKETISVKDMLVLVEKNKIRLKCDCTNGSNVNGSRKAMLYRFESKSPHGHTIENPIVIRYKKSADII